MSLSNVLATTETSADICAIVHVDLALCDGLGDAVSHVPVLSSREGLGQVTLALTPAPSPSPSPNPSPEP